MQKGSAGGAFPRQTVCLFHGHEDAFVVFECELQSVPFGAGNISLAVNGDMLRVVEGHADIRGFPVVGREHVHEDVAAGVFLF